MAQVNNNTNSRAGKHLTYDELVKNEDYKELGYSNRAIVSILRHINNVIQFATVK